MKHGCDFSWISEADCAEVIERVCVRVGAGWAAALLYAKGI